MIDSEGTPVSRGCGIAMMQTQGRRQGRGGRTHPMAWWLGLILGIAAPAVSTGQVQAPAGKPGRVSGAEVAATGSPGFLVGAAARDITPEKPVPMWGYGARHDRLSDGVIDRLQAKALVIEANGAKLAV